MMGTGATGKGAPRLHHHMGVPSYHASTCHVVNVGGLRASVLEIEVSDLEGRPSVFGFYMVVENRNST